MTSTLLDPPTDHRTRRPTGPELLETLKGFSAEIDARSGETDAARAVPADLVERLQAEGMFRLSLPRSLGGVELDPVSTVELIEEASRADGSTGWTIMIGNSPMFFAWLDPDVAASMIGTDGDVMASAMFGPMGRAVPDGAGGFVVDGRWSFNSACVYAGWHALGVMVMDGDGPRMRPDGRPDWRFAYVRHEDVDVIETWDAGGLHGTASHDIVVSALHLPEERTAMPMFDKARHDGPLWRMSFFGLLGPFMAAFPLGVGRRALDEFAAVAAKKSRGAAPGSTLAEDAHVQVRFGQAEGGLRSARAFLFDVVGRAWDTACRGEEISEEDDAQLTLATQQCMRAALEAVDFAYTTVGGSAAYSSHPLQRCFRDIHTATQHLAFRSDNWGSFSKVRFGIS